MTTIKIEMNDLYYRIIRNRVLDLLKIINAKYPDKFPKDAITKELETIMASVVLSKEHEKGKVPPHRPVRHPRPRNIIDPANRCQARIWDDIFDRSTNKQIIDVDDEFHVSDYNDINLKKFSKKYILGKQCSRKKYSTNNYCILHNTHRPHGNYFEQPSKEICLHFMVEGGYLEKST